ncbi:hypothetical protein WJX75_006403 [Coccomyxa subellipsoidea]|uniref:UBA domain-containing protein n=1 Tax=Coccomyxa subellipsoidea TaxID=248742 RepID=A0ABR2YQH4_9CHLO
MESVLEPLKEFSKNSVRLVKRCTKPDRKDSIGVHRHGLHWVLCEAGIHSHKPDHRGWQCGLVEEPWFQILRVLGAMGVVAKETEFAVSPSTPLLSTAIDENGWVCGRNHNGQLGVGGTADVQEPQVMQVVRRWAALSIGESHAAGVSGDNQTYTWGCNEHGQLGVAAGEPSDVPRKMNILRGWDVRAIACGAEHTVAITPDDVITWGSNSMGQCGQGDRAETDWVKPRSIKPLQSMFVCQIVCGRYHTLCVTATSQVFAFGCNSSGQLGLGDFQDRRAPCEVPGLWALPVVSLSAGDEHSTALTANGFLFAWGGNDRGQLGLPKNADAAERVQRTASERRRARRKVNQRFLSAMLDMGIPSEKAELALSETGNVGVEVATEWLFSVPDHVLEKHLASDPSTPTGEVDAAEDHRVCVPRRVPLQGVRAVAAGGQHTVAVTETSVYSWGCNSAGQLGTRTFRDKAAPTLVRDLESAGVTQVACGRQHTLFLCRDGTVYGCGSTEHGQLPYLKFAGGQEGSASDDESADMSAEVGADMDAPQPRNEITIPTQLRMPFLQARGGRAPVVSGVVAGGFSSAFLTSAPDEFPEPKQPHLLDRLLSAIDAASVPLAEDMVAQLDLTDKQHPEVMPHLKPLCTAIDMVFGSAAALSATFGFKDAVGMDMQLLDAVQSKIVSLYAPLAQDASPPQPGAQPPLGEVFARCVESCMYKATNELLDDLHRNYRLLGTPERAQVVLAACQSPLLCERRSASVLIPRLCSSTLQAPSSCRHMLVKWWAEYPEDLLEQRVVRPLQDYLTSELMVTKKLTVSVMNVIKVLAKVEEANQLGRKLPPDAFYNELISDKLDVEDHYVAWRQTHDSPQHAMGVDGPFSFCSYPFLLNPRAKSKLLHTEARFLMTQTVHQARYEHAHGSRLGKPAEDRVLLDTKAAKRSAAGEASTSGRDTPADQDRKDRRRRDRQHGLRGLWQHMWRAGNEAAAAAAANSASSAPDSSVSAAQTITASVPVPAAAANSDSYQVDERAMAAREVTALRSAASPSNSGHNSPTAAALLAAA